MALKYLHTFTVIIHVHNLQEKNKFLSFVYRRLSVRYRFYEMV